MPVLKFDDLQFAVVERIRSFFFCEKGAVAIDWVGLTAGILLLGMALVYAVFNGGVASSASNINQTMEEAGRVINVQPRPDPSVFE